MNYIKIENTSISNGLGFRVVLWCSGCTRKCKGCFNPETWDFNAGHKFDERAKQYIYQQLKKPYIKGITVTGGHPLEPKNITTVQNLLKDIKKDFPQKDVWLYTGYKYEDIKDLDILNYIDVLVDGKFKQSEKDITLAWCGSSNQRVIDIKQTIKNEKITLYEK